MGEGAATTRAAESGDGMSVGGVVIDVVPVTPSKWWVNTMDGGSLTPVAVYCDPQGETIDVGDLLWWQAGSCYWTPRDRSREDVELPKIGYSGVAHPHKRTGP